MEALDFANSFSFNLGYTLGASDMDHITRRLHIRHPLEQFNCLRGNMEETGWSSVTINSLTSLALNDNFRLVIQVENSFEAESWPTSAEPVCVICAGYLLGK